MLKNNTFSASILEGFGPRFGRVFGRFFGPKIHAESDSKKSVRQAKNTVKTNRKSMSASLQQSIFLAKIDENLHVFGTSILIGFWKGFGRVLGSQNPWFSHFFIIFSKHFSNNFLEGQKIEKNHTTRVAYHSFWDGPAKCASPGGEKKRGVQKTNETGILEEALDMNLKKHYWQELGSSYPARSAHLRWAAERCARSAGPYLGGQWSYIST